VGADIVMESITLKIPRSDTGLCPIRGALSTLSAGVEFKLIQISELTL